MWYFREFKTTIYMSFKLHTQVLEYSDTQELSLSLSIKLRLTYETLYIATVKVPKKWDVSNWQVLYLYSR